MFQKIIDRKDIITKIYVEILNREPHDHIIIEDENEILRWKENKSIRDLFDLKILDLNQVVIGLYDKGFDKNSEIYRQLYRDLGYSLDGYWEVFYWDMNNPETDEYVYKESL
jgi:hypothetical protein